MLHVDTSRWNQTPDDLRRLSLEAPHRRTRERFQALYQVAAGRSAFRWSKETGRRPETILAWIRKYNEGGPQAMAYVRSGGRPPLLTSSRQSCAT